MPRRTLAELEAHFGPFEKESDAERKAREERERAFAMKLYEQAEERRRAKLLQKRLNRQR